MGRNEQVGREGRDFPGYQGVLGEACKFISDYVVMADSSTLVLTTWIIAAYLLDVWDRFPHLAITSPEKRCAKTLLLDLLFLLVPKPRYTTNISPAALYRVIEKEKPTLLDESQSLARRGSEASEVIRELLNAGIGRNAKVTRCGGKDRDKIEEFSIYSPKVFAMIGEPDGVLADRSLPVPMKRKAPNEQVKHYRSRVVEPSGQELQKKFASWATKNEKKVIQVYDTLEPFPISNDRMAELLTPLQAVLHVMKEKDALQHLHQYAQSLDRRDGEQETQTPGIRLLLACREIFGQRQEKFLPTAMLVSELVNREEEPWRYYSRGEHITPEALAHLLRPFGVHSQHNKERTGRGYFLHNFQEAWGRYLPRHTS